MNEKKNNLTIQLGRSKTVSNTQVKNKRTILNAI